MDSLHRQRRRHRLQSIQKRHADSDRHRHVLLKHRTFSFHHLHLRRFCIRCGGKQQRTKCKQERDDTRRLRYHSPVSPHRSVRHRNLFLANQPRLDSLHRQRRRHRLSPRTLSGNRLHLIRANRHTDRHHLLKHRTFGKHRLRLPRQSR